MVEQMEQQELCQAVAGWLSYKSLTGLKGLLNESSISVPLAEYLTTRHAGEIQSEVAHPLFDSGSQGRPKQTDFIQKNMKGDFWKTVYECKFQSDTPERLISDICRLLTVIQSEKIGRPRRYFVLAGERENPKSPLERMMNTGTGSRMSVFQNILLREIAQKDIYNLVRVTDLHPKQIELFKKFCVDYGAAIPSSFVTKLRGISIAASYSCAVWQIESARGSKLLRHHEIDTRKL